MQLFAVSFIHLPGYSTCFGRFTHPSSGVQFQLYLQPPVQIIVSSQLPSSSVAWYKQLHLVGYLKEWLQSVRRVLNYAQRYEADTRRTSHSQFWSFQLRPFLQSISSFHSNQMHICYIDILRTYHLLLPSCFDVCYTIFRETIALFAQELHAFWQCCYIGCAIKYKVYLFFFKFTMLVTMLSRRNPTQHTKREEQHDNRISVLSRSPHHYGPKHSWVKWTYVANIHNKY